MASSKGTSYRLCCEPATIEWVMGRMRYSTRLHGWIYPYVSAYHASSTFTWGECPFCGRMTLPFEPTRPYDPQADGETD